MDLRAEFTQQAADGPFSVILADPPWLFASNSDAHPGKNARGHYACMPLPEIASMPVPLLAARDALLLLWVTVPFAMQAQDVIAGWGFRYVSQVVWIKDRIGTGYWARNRHEILIIAKSGEFPCPRPALFPDSVIVGQQREHSRKPDQVHQTVDQRLGHLRRIELFARQRRAGWHSWGNQVDRFNSATQEQEGEKACA